MGNLISFLGFLGKTIFASQVSNSYARISPLVDLVSVYMMCLEISGHPIRLHVTNNMKNKMTVCLVIFKHPTMIFCLDSISPISYILLVYFANNVIFFSNKLTYLMKYGKGDNSYKPIGGRNTPTKSAKGEYTNRALDWVRWGNIVS